MRIDDPSVSRKHACIVSGKTLRVDDLGSANGTWVDGKRLESGGSAALRPGALVEIGRILVVVRDGRVGGDAPARPDGIVVVDPEMARLHQLVEIVGKSALSVILLGETGVGKEVIAARVHAISTRATRPLVNVNCAALVESLLEAELFGYERGAFTGAVQAKPGLLESAHGGTLFLDEVGEMPLSTQAKLLRVLESGEVTRVGSVRPRVSDVRFVAATNRDLRALVARGTFREDLFFRLDGISITIPPLRQRTTEIVPLAEAFLATSSRELGRGALRFSTDAMAALCRHPWPGNARELRNVVARTALLAPAQVIDSADLRFDGSLALADVPRPAPSDAIPPLADEAERRRIADALERAVGNQTRAAKLLGISRGTLLKRLDDLGFPRPRRRD